MFQKILIANRGEIAVRIIRACKDLGIQTVAVYATADKESLHVQLADEAICIGAANSKDSYLNINNILSAALLTKADAIHPGFGFLAENTNFARLVKASGLTFIGPHADVIELMGDKINARQRMAKAKVPIIPGSLEPIQSLDEGLREAQGIGYPVMLKAASGGGGRGMRVLYSDDEFKHFYPVLKQEAMNYFGDDGLYVEKLFINAKHIEVQILADQHRNVLHLYERDCSFQRRHQKVIEEAPCHFLDQRKRDAICQAAVRAAQAVNYDSVGTIEFLMDEKLNFYFMEMNTRIQVEHPVTEMITGVDIVKQQIACADGKALTLRQKDIIIQGHAIECRINAEDYRNDFKPSTGQITFFHPPGGKDVRIDSAIYNGYHIPPYYDSMIAKIITFGDTRLNAIKRMRSALEECIIEGVENNVEFCYFTLFHPTFVTGRYTTDFAGEWIKELKERESTLSKKT
jgi:acetyl-CoA carboxylase, biotin carboxylase subunit